jgi:hypothetical protein
MILGLASTSMLAPLLAEKKGTGPVILGVLSPFFPLAPGASANEAPKVETFTGKVVPLADLVAKTGSKLDADAAPQSLVVVADDGKVYTLIKDSGARLFFKDPGLLNRPMRLTGKLLPGSQILQATLALSLIKGEPHEIYYWCDICSIRRSEKMICECCGGPMERREEPVKK